MGSNMAEAHPVAFQWVVEAKARGARVMHIDPHFTRTSALADTYVPIRAGSDIAFLGGVVNYILENQKEFREYVVAYTNASFIVDDDYRDTEDLDGIFSGFDPDTRSYDPATWQYRSANEPPERESPDELSEQAQPHAAGSGGPPLNGVSNEVEADPTLQHPRCVYQILRRHFARFDHLHQQAFVRLAGDDHRTRFAAFEQISNRPKAELGIAFFSPVAALAFGIQERLDVRLKTDFFGPAFLGLRVARGNKCAKQYRGGASKAREHGYRRMSRMTWPWTSVRRKSRPLKRKVSRSWSSPSKCRIVACRSCIVETFSTECIPSSSVAP